MYKTKKFARFISLLIAVTLAVTVCMPITAFAAGNITTSTLTEGYYLIKCEFCDKYVDCSSGSNNSVLTIQSRNTKTDSQVFHFAQSGGYWKIENVEYGKTVSIKDASKNDCASIVLYDNCNDADQLWEAYSNSDGTYSFSNKNSDLYMDVRGINSTNGTELIQCYWNGGGNQKFRLESTTFHSSPDPWNSNSGNNGQPYNNNATEFRYGNYTVFNYTKYEFDYDSLPTAGSWYLAEAEFIDANTVLDMIIDQLIPSSERKDFIAIARKGRKNGSVNGLIKKTYVTFDVSYKGYNVYIYSSSETVNYVRWTSKTESKVYSQADDFTNIVYA